jgi:hypothetical protein
MEQNNKLEQHFKQKLEQRTIQPTEMAWDRLDAMLTVAEQKKKPNRTWMYMAASFLALLLAGTIFLNQEGSNKNNNIKNGNSVVNSQKQEVIIEDNTLKEITTDVAKPQEAFATTTAVASNKVNHKNVATRSSSKKGNTVKNEVLENTVGTPNQDLVANEVIKKVKTSKTSVNASDLLAAVEGSNQVKASTATASLTKAKQPTIKVNSNSLLSSVESELTESFRDRVLQSVSKNFDKVKTSVAARNHE